MSIGCLLTLSGPAPPTVVGTRSWPTHHCIHNIDQVELREQPGTDSTLCEPMSPLCKALFCRQVHTEQQRHGLSYLTKLTRYAGKKCC